MVIVVVVVIVIVVIIIIIIVIVQPLRVELNEVQMNFELKLNSGSPYPL